MKWKNERHKEQTQDKQEEKKKKPHSSSNFSISNLLPLSWFSKLKLNPTTKGQTTFGPNPRSSNLPEPNTRSASAYLSFSPVIVDRFPPPIPDAPRRLSIGEDEGTLRPQLKHETGVRRRHHQSVGDLDQFTTLGHLVPFSVRPRPLDTDSGTDGSADSDLKLGWPATRLRLRLRRQRNKIERQAEGTRRPSFNGKLRRRPKAKVRVCSPRPSTVRAEEFGRSQSAPTPTVTATAKRRQGRTAAADEDVRKLEQFAVVKSSYDPQRDFRDSMVEMIWEKGIGRPEELEALLACYLSINSDEHHDVIIKVFRQLWFEVCRPEKFPLASKSNNS